MCFSHFLIFNSWNFDACSTIVNFSKMIFGILNGRVQISMRRLEKFSNLTSGTGRLFATEEYCGVKICSLFTFYAESSRKQKNVKTKLTRRCTRIFWGDRNSKTCQPQKFLTENISSLKVVFVVVVVVFVLYCFVLLFLLFVFDVDLLAFISISFSSLLIPRHCILLEW